VPKSYLQLVKQIETLQAEADKIRRSEVNGVVKRIREAIDRYGLTAADLGLATGGAATGPARKKPGPKPGTKYRKRAGAAAGRKSSMAGRKVAPKYRDENGNTWAGRGKRPVWLRTALAGGRKLEDFAIK
jgi:DNA-binding protein H-NS